MREDGEMGERGGSREAKVEEMVRKKGGEGLMKGGKNWGRWQEVRGNGKERCGVEGEGERGERKTGKWARGELEADREAATQI